MKIIATVRRLTPSILVTAALLALCDGHPRAQGTGEYLAYFNTPTRTAGVDKHGQPINIQLLGRAWDDAKLVGICVRVRADRQRCASEPRDADDGAGAPLRSRQVRV